MNTTLCLSIGLCCVWAVSLPPVYIGMWWCQQNIIARHQENLLNFVEHGKIMEAEALAVRVDATASELTVPPPA